VLGLATMYKRSLTCGQVLGRPSYVYVLAGKLCLICMQGGDWGCGCDTPWCYEYGITPTMWHSFCGVSAVNRTSLLLQNMHYDYIMFCL